MHSRRNPIGLRVKFAHDRDIARGLSFVLIANKMAASSSSYRFASLNEDEFEEILLHKDADNTRKATQGAATLFRSYLGEKGQNQEFEKLDKTTLASLLSTFYLEARKADVHIHIHNTYNTIHIHNTHTYT